MTVISASSDRSVKIWNPHDPTTSMIPQTLGTHKDYVRALALAPKANWIASGSFDKTIKVWDLKEMRSTPIFTIAEPTLRTSIYALAVNSWGTIMAAASPEKTIQLWDPRSRQQISQLVGHRDNVRSVVLSKDGSHLLSASSDSTIKLWSLAEQRCLHTFTHHNDSVWSLFSNHDSLDVFYSGDRSGIVCKVDWERCNEVSEGECVVLAKEKTKEGEFKFNRGCPSDAKAAGIYKIVALDDTYFWTATSNSVVSRYKDVQPRSKREALYPIESHYNRPAADLQKQTRTGSSSLVPTRPSALKGHTNSSNVVQTSVSFAENTATSLVRPDSPVAATNYDDKGHQAATLYGLPFASLVCLAPPNDPYGAAIGLGSTSLRTMDRRDSVTGPSPANAMFSSASLISIPSVLKATQQDSFRPYSPQGEGSLGYSPAAFTGQLGSAAHARHLDGARPSSTRSASIRFAPFTAYNPQANEDSNHGSFQDYDADGTGQGDTGRAAHEARQAFEERDSALDAAPLRAAPEDVITGSHGLIRCSMLNDRRHVLAIDSSGQIFLWDIVCAQCLGAFDWVEVAKAWSQEEGSAKEVHLLPGDALDIVKERIQGEATTPMWCTVDTRVGSLSVHFDYPRCFDAEIYLDEMADVLEKNDVKFDSKEDDRINVARLVLRNLFDGFVHQEALLRRNEDAGGLKKGQLAMEKPKVVGKKPNLKLELGKRLQHAAESIQTPGMTVALAVAAKTPAILPVASPLTPQPKAEMPSMQQLLKSDRNGTPSDAASHAVMDDYFSIANNGPSEAKPQTPQPRTPSAAANAAVMSSPISPGGGLMGRLRMSIKRGDQSKKEEKGPLPTGSGATASTSGELDAKGGPTEAKQPLDHVRRVLQMADPKKVIEDMPRIPFPPSTAIMISEASSDSVDFHVDYLGLVKSTEADVANLEVVCPTWLLEFLVGASDHSPPLKEKDKLTFLLMPWEVSKNDGLSTSQMKTMPAMPTGNSRLTATKMLRAKKACIYVAEKLDLVEGYVAQTSPVGIDATKTLNNEAIPQQSSVNGSTNPRNPFVTQTDSKAEAHDMIELLCNGVVVPAHCTLAQIHRFYWKSSNILRLDYRWRQA
jgi:WD repeat-containing protein 48